MRFDRAYVCGAQLTGLSLLGEQDVPGIGEPASVGAIGIAVGLLLIVLVTVSVIQRRRAMTGKIRGAHEAQAEK